MDEHLIEEIGMRLANRAYLYRIFHIVFGTEPSSEELSVLSAQETIEALKYLSAVEQKAPLSFETELQKNGQETSVSAASAPAPSMPASKATAPKPAPDTLSDVTALFASLGEKTDDADYIDTLKSNFTRLFLVPSKSYVYPWESPYVGREMLLFQESTLDVRNRYREHGFAAVEFGHFPEDHISMMLDFLAHLSTRLFDAFCDGKDEDVRWILSSQESFLAEHIMNWISLFQESLNEKDNLGFYSQSGEALRVFLEIDRLFLKDALLADWAS